MPCYNISSIDRGLTDNFRYQLKYGGFSRRSGRSRNKPNSKQLPIQGNSFVKFLHEIAFCENGFPNMYGKWHIFTYFKFEGRANNAARKSGKLPAKSRG
jgi:hypothetical protein